MPLQPPVAMGEIGLQVVADSGVRCLALVAGVRLAQLPSQALVGLAGHLAPAVAVAAEDKVRGLEAAPVAPVLRVS